MSSIFLNPKTGQCRVCGAVKAEIGNIGFCVQCEAKCNRFSGYKITDDSINAWLGRELVLQLRRLQKYGFARRCEAISDGNSSAHAFGYGVTQCGCPAIDKVRGRYLCGVHSRRTGAHRVTFVDDERTNDYLRLSNLLSELCEADKEFRHAVECSLI